MPPKMSTEVINNSNPIKGFDFRQLIHSLTNTIEKRYRILYIDFSSSLLGYYYECRFDIYDKASCPDGSSKTGLLHLDRAAI